MGSKGDSDIFVKYMDIPNHQNFDVRNIDINDEYSVLLENPTPGKYYVGVNGWRESVYDISVTQDSNICDSEIPCSKHGDCESGESSCTCEDGFTGKSCETMSVPMEAGVEVSGYVARGEWNYYYFFFESANNAIVTVNEENEDGDCDLFPKQGDDNPTQKSFDEWEIGFSSTMKLTLPPAPKSNPWRIGVSGFRPCHYSIKFEIADDNEGNTNGGEDTNGLEF